ncbi:hypothetical protein RJT34_12499 [Clitoria ternatea]|uniref:Uncharacterized protein n=1 Tax=Clitoria ternatea TaxID=43366 RepID=A0AAN9JLV9_CLITE
MCGFENGLLNSMELIFSYDKGAEWWENMVTPVVNEVTDVRFTKCILELLVGYRLWVKSWHNCIVFVSFEDMVDIKNLSFAYTFVGVDCIDYTVEALIVKAMNEGFEVARNIDCPVDCSRLYENLCPANVISFQGKSTSGISYNTEAPRDTTKPMFQLMAVNWPSYELWCWRRAIKESIAFVVHLAKAKERPLGFLQLVGGTNQLPLLFIWPKQKNKQTSWFSSTS